MALRRTILAGLLSLALAGPAAAEDEDEAAAQDDGIQRIGIEELLDVTVRRSPGLARARASAGIARAEERTVRGRDDWQIQLAIDGTRTKQSRIAGQPVQVLKQEVIRGSAAVVRDLPTGGELRLEAEASRIDETHLAQNLAMGVAPGQQTTTSSTSQGSGRISLTHSILRGLGPSVARADRAQAKIRSKAASFRARVAAGELTRDVLRSYWELAHAALELQIRRASLSSVRKLHKETQRVVREGGRPTSDLKVAEYTMAVREESVLRAELVLEERALELRRVAGLEIGGGEIALWPHDIPGVGGEAYVVGQLVARGLARNAALNAIALDDQDATIEVRVAGDGVRPRLDVRLSAGSTAAGSDVDEAVRLLGEGGNIEASAGLFFSLDLGANAARGRRDAAVLRHRTVRIQREELRREIASSIVLAVHQIRSAQKRAVVAAKAIELAKANLGAEQALFRVGRSSTHQLFERQGELDDARLSRARAIADYHESLASLQTLTGDILAQHRIEVID